LGRGEQAHRDRRPGDPGDEVGDDRAQAERGPEADPGRMVDERAQVQ